MGTGSRLGGRFWRLWTAAAASSLGDGMLAVALPLLATTLTADERLIAGVAVAETLPWLLFAILAGTIADRRSYRQVLITSDVTRAVILAIVAVRLLTHGLSIYVVLAAAFGLGMMKPLFDAAAYRALPSVVDDELLVRANGYMEATITTGDETIGRAVGGVLYAIAASAPIIGDAASFAVSALLLRSLPPDAPIVDPAAPKTSLRADMAAGLRWFVHNRLIRLLAGMVSVLAIAQSIVFGVLVLIAERHLGLSAKGFGLFFGAIAIGGIVGNLVAGPIEAKIGQLRLILGAIVVVAAGYLVTWSTTSAVIAGAALAIEVAATAAASIVIVTIRQRVIPRALIGRVSNVARTFTWGALPVGSALGGVLAHRFGVRSTLLVAGALTLAVGIVGGPSLARHIGTANGSAA